MTSILGSIFSEQNDVSADQMIAYNSAAGSAAAAQAYLAATLTATTPEVRRLFSEYCTQSVMGHEAIMGLMIKNGWAKPYDTPGQQLQSVVLQSQPVVSNSH